MRTNARRAVVCAFIALMCLCAAGARADGIAVHFPALGIKEEVSWTFPYDDAWFSLDPNTYHHELARSSLGLACSAFRSAAQPLSGKAANVLDFYRQAGFTGVSCEQFDITPTSRTIATAIASRGIGDFTLVAVAVSGQGYRDEWMSNFTIGALMRHEGFDGAAGIVADRVLSYIADNAIEGPVKVWITGYSRAAAVSNLTAVRLLAQEEQPIEALYAYCFATPNSTREPEAYPSIFNIVGQFDPVASIPFAEWGYGKPGTTLHLPAIETNRDFALRAKPVNGVYRKLTGIDFYVNPECDWMLQKAMALLENCISSAEEYADSFQNVFLTTWAAKGSAVDMVTTCVRQLAALRASDAHARLSEEIGGMWTLLSQEAYNLVLIKLGLRENTWNDQVTLTANLMHEHAPQRYVAWMFAYDDPGKLFTTSTAYERFCFTGPVQVCVLDGDLDVVAANDGNTPIPDRMVSLMRVGDVTVATLPDDGEYLLGFEATGDGTMTCLFRQYSVGYVGARTYAFSGIPVKKDDLLVGGATDESGAPGLFRLSEGDDIVPVTPDYDSGEDENSFETALIEIRMSGNRTFNYLNYALVALLILILVPSVGLPVRRRIKKRRAAKTKAAQEQIKA